MKERQAKKTKQASYFLLFLTLFVMLFGIQQESLAVEKPLVVVSSDYEERSGRVVEVAVFIHGVQNLAAGDLILNYDPEVVQLVEIARGEVLEGVLYAENTKEASQGKVAVAWASPTDIPGQGTLLEISFRLKKSKGQSVLALGSLHLYDVAGREISVQQVDGRIMPFNGQRADKKAEVQPDKVWTLEFNVPVNRGTVNRHTVTVKNVRNGEPVEVNVSWGDDGRKMMVEPLINYQPGDYVLTLGEQLLSSAGRPLNQAFQMEFEVR